MISIAIFALFAVAGMLHLGVKFSDASFPALWYPYEIILAVTAVALWYVLLRKEIALNFSINFNKAFFITLPMVLIPLLLLVYVLFTSETLENEKLAMFFATAVAVGIAEELIFRVAGYRVLLASGSSVKKAILLSALLFSLFHLTNIAAGQGVDIMGQLVITFMMGVILAYIYYRTESILYVMIIHFMWDLSLFIIAGFGDAGSPLNAVSIPIVIGYFIWAIINVLKLKNHNVNSIKI
jgi:membrane protease YdiL (CAAX protease family)